MNYLNVINFINHYPYALAVGGLGDLLITIATAYEHPNIKILYFSSTGHLGFARDIIKAFGFGYYIDHLTFDDMSKILIKSCSLHKNVQVPPIVPIDLNYAAWWNRDKYQSMLVTSLPLVEQFGTIAAKNNFLVAIAPTGSITDKTCFKSITPEEFSHLVRFYQSQGVTVYGIGSETNDDFFCKHVNCNWISSEYTRYERERHESTVLDLFRFINSCDQVISVDTWVKTYSALAGIPTTVIPSRKDNEWIAPDGGELHIFLDKRIWKSIQVMTLDHILLGEKLYLNKVFAKQFDTYVPQLAGACVLDECTN